MKKVIITILIVLIVQAVALVVLVYSGAYNISTLNHDNAVVNRALATGTTRSIVHHAKRIKAPPLTDPAMVQEGFKHYQEMCVFCHGAPGVEREEIAKGLWPEAPDLANAASMWTPAQLFWITKFGIKFTAMPAWGPTHSDEKIWDIVAFLKKLPQLSPADYQEMKQKTTGEPAQTGKDDEHQKKN